ncbi:hypothetical protein [Arthrobacter sp. SX1312]|uniref:hypothetical protein n=1 Tax=Arthrobacter sp. SX1312 TaxID=2058896 RepID=UPI000CE4EE40|nr:hypothetical protein [Arthrobacter sp. SX1312]
MLLADPHAGVRRVLAGTEAQSSVAMSGMLFDTSPAAVVFARQLETGLDLTDADLTVASSAAVGLQVPLLVVGPGGSDGATVDAELTRLGVETVIGYGDPAADWAALIGQRALVVGPTEAADFDGVLDVSTTPEAVPESDVAASIGRLSADDARLLTLEPAPAATPTPSDPGPATPGPASTTSTDSVLADTATAARVPPFTPAGEPIDALVLATPSSAPAPLATARAAGIDVELVADADPRSTSTAVDAVRSRADGAVLAVGAAFGAQEVFAQRVQVAATAPQLPGGGQTVFPGRRMVALYGHPSGPSLGALGEQGIDETIARVKGLAARYQPFSDEPVVPALDLIATIASAEPGTDGDYSSETPIDVLRPWVDAAEEQGVYVVLDLQSGRSDFLSQARLYEELLTRPTVGLALDPEWRLLPGERPLQQIGSVSAAEINATTAWLADLTRDRALPQKLVMVHQFRIDMISYRADLDVSRSELAVTLHADGHGTPGQKLDTWSALQGVSPAGTWPSWKNFHDEDQPMLTPEQTYSLVDPKPWLVTYQ